MGRTTRTRVHSRILQHATLKTSKITGSVEISWIEEMQLQILSSGWSDFFSPWMSLFSRTGTLKYSCLSEGTVWVETWSQWYFVSANIFVDLFNEFSFHLSTISHYNGYITLWFIDIAMYASHNLVFSILFHYFSSFSDLRGGWAQTAGTR